MENSLSESAPTNRPEYSLYSQSAINMATAFGSIIVGSFLIASNLKKINRTDEVLQTYIFGIVSFIIIMVLLIKVPLASKIPDVVVQLIQIGLIYLFTNFKISADLKSHDKQKGPFYSNWRAIGISFLFLPLIIGVFIGLDYLTETKVDFGKGQVVYYEYDANPEQAKILGKHLLKIGFFGNENPIDVRIGKTSSEITVTFFVVKDGWLNKDALAFFTSLRQELSQDVFTEDKVKIILCDEFNNPKKTISE